MYKKDVQKQNKANEYVWPEETIFFIECKKGQTNTDVLTGTINRKLPYDQRKTNSIRSKTFRSATKRKKQTNFDLSFPTLTEIDKEERRALPSRIYERR